MGDQFNASGSKYLRSIALVGGKVDVYAVLVAFSVTCPARQHAIKKLLCAGLRGKNSEIGDLSEARDAIERSIQIEEARARGDQDILPLASVDNRYKDLLDRLGVNGHEGAIIEIDLLREKCGLNDDRDA